MALEKRAKVVLVGVACALIVLIAFFASFSAPADFPKESIVHVTSGSSVTEAAQELSAAHIIRHPYLFEIILRITGESHSLKAGFYIFDEPLSALAVAYRIVTGHYGATPVRTTFIEGSTIREMGIQLHGELPYLTVDGFMQAAQGQEGYLFPDTYFLQAGMDAQAIVSLMRQNFEKRTNALLPDIALSGHSISDIITMASLIEKEAKTDTDRRIVAGILWNRIARKMPLQVDAVFGYIFKRETYSPSPADLKVSSPYNTYLHTGLPPGPIDNPGLDSIDAATHPTKTDYLYYMSDSNGVLHFAKTYADHQANLRKYGN